MMTNTPNDNELMLTDPTNRRATDEMSGQELAGPGAARADEHDLPLSANPLGGACRASAGQGRPCFKRSSSANL